MDSQYLKRPIKATEYRTKKYHQASSRVTIPDQVTYYVPNTSDITLYHSIVKDCLGRGYSR